MSEPDTGICTNTEEVETMAPKIVCVVGPTACGKTTLGVLLAKKFNGEVVSADSMQIYRGMKIGRAHV